MADTSAVTPSTLTRSQKRKHQVKCDENIQICHNCLVEYSIIEIGMDSENYNFMKENKIPGYVWLCSLCLIEPRKQFNDFQKTLLEKFEKLQNQIETNETKNKVDELEKYIDSRLQNLENKISNKVDKQKDDLNKNINNFVDTLSVNIEKQKEALNKKMTTFADVVSNNSEKNSNKTSSAITSLNKQFSSLKTNIENNINSENEKKIQKSKAKNIIVFNVPESDGDENEAYKKDILKVKSILQEKLNLKKEDVKDIRRIPRERQENKVRPIRIIFNHLEKRSEALKLRNIFYKTNEIEGKN